MRKYLICAFLAYIPFPLWGESPFCCKGRVDVGPAYLHINALEEGKVAHSYDIFGIRSDSTLLFFEGSGFALKPTITYGDKDAKFFAYGLGIGYYIPIGKQWYVIPVVGASYTNFSTKLTLNFNESEFPGTREWIHSRSYYAGGEIGYQICTDFWISCIYQYAWARSQTNLSNDAFILSPNNTITQFGDSSGSNAAISLDYYWKCFSIGVAGGYNRSLNKEKFGIEGYGVKISLGYCLVSSPINSSNKFRR